MIYPATLILATIVFNAAAGLGAPVRITQSQHVSRADADDITARSTIIDVPARVRSVASDPVDARSDTASENDIRDTPSQPLEARDSLPEVDRLVRRFPRAHYARFYERQSNQPEARAPSPEPEAAQLERRYPRRALYERHESAPVEARSEPVETPELERRLPRRGLYERYVKRSTPPSAPEQPVAREPIPEQAEPVYRRFPRKVYADAAMEKRQEEPAATPAETPAGQPTAAGETPAATAEGAVPTGDASASAPAATGEATATASASASGAATATASASTTTAIIAPSTPLTSGNPGTPSNLEGLIRNITANADDGFQEGTTIKETTLLVNKITHISGSKDKPAQNIVESQVLATTVTATPSSPSATATSSAAPSAAVTGAPEVATQAGESSSAAATETPAATATSAPEAQPTNTAAGEAAPGGDASAGAARRALGTGNLRARNIGFSGAAYASYAKRNVN